MGFCKVFLYLSSISENSSTVFLKNGRSHDGQCFCFHITDFFPFKKNHDFDNSETLSRVQTFEQGDKLVTQE